MKSWAFKKLSRGKRAQTCAADIVVPCARDLSTRITNQNNFHSTLFNSERGGTLLFNVFFVSTVFTTIGMFVNLGDMMTKKQLAQHVADTCAVSAAEMGQKKNLLQPALQGYLQAIGAQICQTNLQVKGVSTATLPWSAFNITATNNAAGQPDGVKVSLAIPSAGFFSGFGYSGTAMSGSAEYRFVGGSQPIIASLVLETTKWPGPNEFPNDEHIQQIRNAANAFLDQLDIGDYISIVGMSGHATVHLPMTKIVKVKTAVPGELSKAEIQLVIDAVQRPATETAAFARIVYGQGAIYRARKEISDLEVKLSADDWNAYRKVIVMGTTGRFDGVENTANNFPPAYPLSAVAQCYSAFPWAEVSGRAVALREADLARQSGIDVFVNCSGGPVEGNVSFCSAAGSGLLRQAFNRITMDSDWNGVNGGAWAETATQAHNIQACTGGARMGYYQSAPDPNWTKGSRFNITNKYFEDMWVEFAKTANSIKGGRLME